MIMYNSHTYYMKSTPERKPISHPTKGRIMLYFLVCLLIYRWRKSPDRANERHLHHTGRLDQHLWCIGILYFIQILNVEYANCMCRYDNVMYLQNTIYKSNERCINTHPTIEKLYQIPYRRSYRCKYETISKYSASSYVDIYPTGLHVRKSIGKDLSGFPELHRRAFHQTRRLEIHEDRSKCRQDGIVTYICTGRSAGILSMFCINKYMCVILYCFIYYRSSEPAQWQDTQHRGGSGNGEPTVCVVLCIVYKWTPQAPAIPCKWTASASIALDNKAPSNSFFADLWWRRQPCYGNTKRCDLTTSCTQAVDLRRSDSEPVLTDMCNDYVCSDYELRLYIIAKRVLCMHMFKTTLLLQCIWSVKSTPHRGDLLFAERYLYASEILILNSTCRKSHLQL